MAIVKMSKFSLLTFGAKKEELLHELQKFQYVHFLNLKENEDLLEIGLEKIEVPERIASINDEIKNVSYVIDLLTRYSEKKSGLQSLKEGMETLEFPELEERAQRINYRGILEKIHGLDQQKKRIEQEIAAIEDEIAELTPWETLDISFAELYSFKQCQTFLGLIPKKRMERFQDDFADLALAYYEIVHTDSENAYILVLSHRSIIDEALELLKNHSFARVEFSYSTKPAEQIDSLKSKVKKLHDELVKIEDDFVNLSSHLPEFEIVYEYLMNKKIRVSAQENFLKSQQIVVIEGYIPTDMENEFHDIVKRELGNIYYLELKEADRNDPDVPILLTNSKFSGAFESLTSMYALPKYNEIDPTPLFALFYCIFFGMMVADFGYGLILWLGTAVILRFFKLAEKQKKTIRFFHYLSYATMFWGVIYGSFLGGIIELPALINPSEQYNHVLILSIALGIIHIFYALGIQGYIYLRDGKPLDALYDVGFWYMLLGGAIIYLTGMFVPRIASYENIALTIMGIGAVGIVLTGGRDKKTIGSKLIGGLYSLYGVSSYVGDFVSYSRLMALGLSGGFIASAINLMVRMLINIGFVGWIFGILVFIIGQAFNIFLSCLSGYVHTIRLTYVEFFGKFYEGGGKSFRLFRSEPKYIDLK